MGDLGNIEADATGRADVSMTNPKAKLSGWYGIVGRTLAVYEGENDLGEGNGNPLWDEAQSKINGNAGNIVACCVIRNTQDSFLPSGARCERTSVSGARPECLVEHECCGAAVLNAELKQ